MLIRLLSAEDAAAYRALRLRMLREFPDAFTSSYEEDMHQPLSWVRARLTPAEGSSQQFVLGAFSDSGELIGSVGLRVEARQKQRHKAQLFGMFVARETMGRGIGRDLLAACIVRAGDIGALEQITLSVTATNARVKQLYEAAGFHTFGIEERAVRSVAYYPKAHMVLHLSSDTAAESVAPSLDSDLAVAKESSNQDADVSPGQDTAPTLHQTPAHRVGRVLIELPTL